jgi:hypothetical protein
MLVTVTDGAAAAVPMGVPTTSEWTGCGGCQVGQYLPTSAGSVVMWPTTSSQNSTETENCSGYAAKCTRTAVCNFASRAPASTSTIDQARTPCARFGGQPATAAKPRCLGGTTLRVFHRGHHEAHACTTAPWGVRDRLSVTRLEAELRRAARSAMRRGGLSPSRRIRSAYPISVLVGPELRRILHSPQQQWHAIGHWS